MSVVTYFTYDYLIALAFLCGTFGLIFFIASLKALFKLRLLKFGNRLVISALFIPITVISLLIITGVQGYYSFTQEKLIATVELQPIQHQQFSATFVWSDHSKHSFILEGDQIQMDAYVLKWKPIGNFLGLHTHFKMDRVSGRYLDITKAREQPLSTYSLSDNSLVDIAQWRLKHNALQYLVDAEYGSATFITADKPIKVNLYISTSGLLIRPIKSDTVL